MSRFVEFKEAPFKGGGEFKDRKRVLIDLGSIIVIDELPEGSSGPECNISLSDGTVRTVLGALEQVKMTIDQTV